MTSINVIKLAIYSFSILCNIKIYSQKIEKEKLYLLLSNYRDNCKYDFLKNKFKVNKPEGIQFNLCGKAILLGSKRSSRDTLPINILNKFSIDNAEDIEKKANMWRKRNEIKLKKKYGVLYKQATEYKNNIFNTYIIEKINSKQIVVYEVKFRNEGAIE